MIKEHLGTLYGAFNLIQFTEHLGALCGSLSFMQGHFLAREQGRQAETPIPVDRRQAKKVKLYVKDVNIRHLISSWRGIRAPTGHISTFIYLFSFVAPSCYRKQAGKLMYKLIL